jgi:hypothetical protein
MKLADIEDQWEKDSKTVRDHYLIPGYIANVPSLHSKYQRILNYERRVLNEYKKQMNKLYLEKLNFMMQPPADRKEWPEGWDDPPLIKGTVIQEKKVADAYVKVDNDIVVLQDRINNQELKVDTLLAIRECIRYRDNLLKNLLTAIKYAIGND